MSGWDQAKYRGELLLTYAMDHPDERERVINVCRKALPLISRANLFDPTRGLRMAWYQVKKDLGITEDAP